MRVSDFIANYLKSIGVKHVFLVAGGGMMHLLDSIGRCEGISYICNHHEQASAMAAGAYARQTNSLGVCYATSGPGATNTITGVLEAWQDSAPVLFITGQSKVSQTIRGSKLEGLRQFGTFEVDIVPIIQSITKYSVFLDDPRMIRFHLEKAIKIALSGRPGPVFIDIPIDIQAAPINPDELIPSEDEIELKYSLSDENAYQIVDKIKAAKRPLILAGHGIRCADAVSLFRSVIKKLNVPVVTTQLAKDLLSYDDPLFIGHPGVKGDRAGNLAIQNADVILSIGSSLHVTTTGYELDRFAVNAYKIQVDIDKAVLSRESVGVQQKIVCDVITFLQKIEAITNPDKEELIFNEWQKKCGYWKENFAVINEPHKVDEERINYYSFIETLNELLNGGETIVTDAGSAYYVVGQAFKVKENQRVIVSGALGTMGYAVPASLGVSASDPNLQVVCITGEGSLLTNIQELQTISHNGFNVKMFIVNNDGYSSIRNSQKNFFSGYHVGASTDSGVSFPEINYVAKAFKIPYIACNKHNIKSYLLDTLQRQGPVICEIFAMQNQDILPTVSSIRLENGSMQSKPLHDMFPFLSEEQLLSNMYKD
ncbi:MAG: thiamine pyrophosphate-binding protein [Planktothrix sp.]|uniref:thiamine pyrophosphate-binding protein n=1 Tax=Planktothrix sp. TaxID=3088171 RepID=UPI0038D39A95